MITGYDNLPIGKYQRVIDALRTRKDDIDAHVAIIAILYDKTEDEVLNMPLPEYSKLSERVGFLLHEIPKFKARVRKEYHIGKMTLIPVTDAKKFTAAQYIDYQTLIKEDNKLIELISTFLIPKGCTYANGYDMADVHEAISLMSVQDVGELSAFFLQRFQNSINYSLICLELHIRMMFKKKERKEILMAVKCLRNLLKDGDGFRRLMQSPRS